MRASLAIILGLTVAAMSAVGVVRSASADDANKEEETEEVMPECGLYLAVSST